LQGRDIHKLQNYISDKAKSVTLTHQIWTSNEKRVERRQIINNKIWFWL